MKLLDKIKNRYNIVVFVLVILMVALSFRLAILTIADGDYYRDISDNKRLKEIQITPPRGEIRDRYGRLLAGNRPTFTVQLLKDELDIKNIQIQNNERFTSELSKKQLDELRVDIKNNGILNLVRLLEEDGANVQDEFPLELNVFKYRNEVDYINEISNPMDKIIEIILDNDLEDEILSTFYIHKDYSEHYEYITINKAINAIKNKGIEVPISTKIFNEELVVQFQEGKDIKKWKSFNGIPEEASPIESIIKLINKDKIIIRKIIDHSLSRLLTYNLLNERDLVDNIILEDYTISFEEEYLKQKRSLARSFTEINMNSPAKEDFVNIFKSVSLENFLDRVIVVENNDKNLIVPGKILLEMIKEKNIEVPLQIELTEDNNSPIYKYTGDIDIGETSLIQLTIDYADRAGVLDDFITSEQIRAHAQSQLLNDGVNPKISIAKDFEYVALNNLKNWYTAKKMDENLSVKETFIKLKEFYKINPNLSPYETRSIFNIYDQLNKQGHLAYQPINIAYGIKDSTVARIEEGLLELPGINISIEPVRYYPEGTTAAHILGYLGKISTTGEVKKYVEENKYSPSAIIGKTGIEESYEDMLRGKSGVKRVQVDVVGNTTKIIEEIKPVPGDNIYVTMDLKLQKVAEEALEQTLKKIQIAGTYESPWGDFKFDINKPKKKPYVNATSGAVVAIDVKTGQVLAMASYPSYDLNLFSTGISTTDWNSLFPENESDPLAPRPLYNIATQTAVQPGSTFKMVTALAALEKGLDPNKKIRDMGFIEIGDQPFRCLLWTNYKSTHGYENVYEALRDSCNYYFYSLALGENQKTGEQLGIKLEIEDIVDLSKKLGLNDKTGIEINIPSETAGGVPNPQKKVIGTKAMLKKYLNKDLEKYLKEDVIIDEVRKKEIIDEIISWLELENILTRNQVIKGLSDLGIEPERKLKGDREGLADKIKYTYINFSGWNITDTLYVTIGQGQSAYTPIQMANYIATVANGGYKHDLTLIDNVKNYNNSSTSYTHKVDPKQIELNNYENLEHVKKGMLMVSEDGTSRKTFANFPIAVGSKTGTAEKGGLNPSTEEKYDDFAWFVGFAPFEDPEIAIAAVIFQGGSGGYAGPMVRDIMAEYLGLNKIETKENLPFSNKLSK